MRNNPISQTWTEHRLRELRDLWAQGLSTARIAARLHVSKNAVVGKAHRLDLPGRPSPFRRNTPKSLPPPRPCNIPRLAELVALSSNQIDRPKAAAPRARDPRAPAPRARDSATNTGKSACCWPIGEPRTATFRFCGGAAGRGKPYCPDHADCAYVPRATREERSPY